MHRSRPPLAAAPHVTARTAHASSRVHHIHSVRLSEVLSALTYALDLTAGQRPGHTLRTAIVAMRLGGELGLDRDALGALYFASLLKDAGCSSNAARMAALFGSDDHAVKRNMRLVDWHDRFRLAMRTARNCGVGLNPLARLRHLLLLASAPDPTRDIIQARCERGAQIALGLGFPASTSEAINFVDEHWCGLGHPTGLAGDAIPILSRVLLLAQTVEAYWNEHGVDAALDMARKRRERWFDPTLVDIVLSWKRDRAWWHALADTAHIDAMVVALEPSHSPMAATPDRLDAIAQAFASVIDAKTPFTYRHSTNVARYAMGIGAELGFDAIALRRIMHAGLLHDIGKLGISNRILDKPSSLTDAERAEVMKHPIWTFDILDRVSAFRHFADDAARHHERLDGHGYPWRLRADKLGITARILAIADVYEALTADRPYREGMGIERTLQIMANDVDAAFDDEAFEVAVELARKGDFERMTQDADAASVYRQLAGAEIGMAKTA